MAETQNRTARDAVSREKTTRYVYRPPSALPEVIAEPGYGYRWIMTHILGKADPTNVSKKMREGWVPVKASDHPELQYAANPNGNVEIGGLMLCKMPLELIRSRNEYYENVSRSQTEAVDNNFMRQSDPRMPLFNERKSSTSFGKGS